MGRIIDKSKEQTNACTRTMLDTKRNAEAEQVLLYSFNELIEFSGINNKYKILLQIGCACLGVDHIPDNADKCAEAILELIPSSLAKQCEDTDRIMIAIDAISRLQDPD